MMRDLSTFNFLVTGGAGFIGSNIVEYLVKFGAGKVRVLDNLSNGYIENIQPFIDAGKIEFINGDIRDYETCRLAVRDIDYVFHEAALGSVPRSIKDPITTNEVNISGFVNMLVASKESESVKRFIYAASSSTYGDSEALPKREENIGNPLSPYAVTKLANELYARIFSNVYNLETIGLRYFNVFGPKQSPDNPYASVIPLFIKSALNKKAPIIYGDGQTSRDFTFIENVIQANIKSLFVPIDKFLISNVACGEKITLTELWQLIATTFDCSGISPLYQQERQGDIKHSLASLEIAKKMLGYTPYFHVQEGISIMKNFLVNKEV
jgi:UDP-N-acetylglucosamine 4-epimerase